MPDSFMSPASAMPHASKEPPGAPPPTRRTIRGVWIFIIVASAILLARGLLTPASPTSTVTPVPGQTVTPLPPAPLVGHLAPEVTLLDLTGHQVPISSFRGRVVVLNFWYVACDPCRYEMPLIEKLNHADSDHGLVVVGLNIADSASDIATYIHALGVDYTILRDDGTLSVVAYNIIDTPTTFVIDRQGVIRAKFVGAITESATLEHAVSPLLAAR